MGNSNGKITAPVSLHADIYPVLGLTKSGTFYDTGWVCGNEHGKINMYSGRKPYRTGTQQDLTEDEIKKFTYGMTPVTFLLAEIRSSESTTKSLVWGQWQPPRPGTDWCRITDWEGYDHTHKVESIAQVKLYNSQNPNSPLPVVVKEVDQGYYTAGYYAELHVNRDAQVDLLEMYSPYGTNMRFADMYLTLIIGANINGLNGGAESWWAQAGSTLGQQLGENGTVAKVYMDTSKEGFQEMLDINNGQNIVALGLSTRKWTENNGSELYSLAMYRTDTKGVIWNSSYALYGDGSGGGQRPDYVMYGHLSGLTNRVNLQNNSDDGRGTIFILYAGSYPSVVVTEGSGGRSGLNVGVALQYEVRAVDGSGGTTAGGDRMTELTLMTGPGSQSFIEGPSVSPWNGRMGVLVQLGSYYPGAKYTVRCRFYVYTQSPSGAVDRVSFRDDKQGQGFQTEWFEAGTITVN